MNARLSTFSHGLSTAVRTSWPAILFFLMLHFIFALNIASAGEKPPGKPLIHPGYVDRVGALPMVGDAVGGAVRDNAGFTANVLPANDDGYTGLVPIGFNIDFGGATRTECYVNNNGNITFLNAMSTYTPFTLSSATGPLFAPFFADVDTRGSGSALVTYGSDTVDGHPAFGVNWVDVGYYSYHTDKLNSFQLVVIDRSDIAVGDFDIEFNYDSITWETGDASGGQDGFGGTPARAGYSDGAGATGDWLELTGSGISGALLNGGSNALISGSLDSSQPGRYVFHFRQNAAAAIKLQDMNPANEGVTVTSAVADGATKVRVRCEANAPGVVAFICDRGTESVDLGDSFEPAPGYGSDLSNMVLQLVGDKYRADAIYTVPEGLTGEATHDIYFRGTYTPDDGSPTALEDRTLQLKRPPVVLVHGLWSNMRDCWTNDGSGADTLLEAAGFDVRFFDYMPGNARSFSTNSWDLLSYIDRILGTIRDSHTAITRVDVVCHSMGGDIARTAIRNQGAYSGRTFGKGLIRRLITLGTPHMGSPFADLLWEMHNGPNYGPLVDDIFRWAKRPIDQGAIEDLCQNSNALQSMGATAVSSFALIGSHGVEALQNDRGWLDIAFLVARFLGLTDAESLADFVYTDIMNSQDSDGIVKTGSQGGGLASTYTYTPDGPLFHTSEPGSDDMGQKATDLLGGPVSHFATGFPAVSSLSSKAVRSAAKKLGLAGKVRAALDTPLVTITEPASGAVFAPGDQIVITAVPVEGANVQAVLFTIGDGTGHAALVDAGPFTATFTIASDFVGSLVLSAAARDDAGNMATTTCTVTVQSAATVQSIAVSPSPMLFLSVGVAQQVSAIGNFSDGVARDISTSDTGTTYSMENTSVASVDTNGLVTSVGPGSTRLRVANGSANTQTVVQVSPEAPSVASVTPGAVEPGTSGKTLTITGLYLGSATSVQFLLNGEADALITVDNIQVDASGNTLTANLTVDATATLGARTVVVTTPYGSSTTTAGPENQLFLVTVSFTGTPLKGPTPLKVKFTDKSVLAEGITVTARKWTFGDGGTSTAQNPNHIYKKAGKYTVQLNITMSTGDTFSVKRSQYVTAYARCKAVFSASPRNGKLPLKVKFKNTSTGAYTKQTWKFGDRKVSTAKNPTHVYSKAGKYTVTLTVTGPGGKSTLIRKSYITVKKK